MKIALLGAAGNVGRVLTQEALLRGHQVVALVTDKQKMADVKGVDVLEVNALDQASLSKAFEGQDLVISALGPKQGAEETLVQLTKILIGAAKDSAVPRLIAVGGAGGLKVDADTTLAQSGFLPAEWMPIVDAHIAAFDLYTRETELNWTVLRPSSFFSPGERTGHFRLGTDFLLTDSEGNSRISFEDFAVALFDEVEHSAYNKKSFTAGY